MIREDRSPKWAKWQAMPYVELWEGVALSANIDPGKVQWRYETSSGQRIFLENEEFKDRLEIARRNLSSNGPLQPLSFSYSEITTIVALSQFAAWAVSLTCVAVWLAVRRGYSHGGRRFLAGEKSPFDWTSVRRPPTRQA